MERQNKQSTNYNQSHRTKDLPPLHLQENVLIQHRAGKWEPATVTQVGSEPRSYHCTTKTGKTFRRNRHHIQSTCLPDDDVLPNQPTPRKSAMIQPGSNTKNKEKKKVIWSDNVYITVDAETAYCAATQHADIFAIVEDTQILITLPFPAGPNPAETTPNAEEATLDTAETVTNTVQLPTCLHRP